MSGILALLTPHGDPQKAAEMARYHKTDRPVLGVANPVINETVTAWRADRPIADWLTEAEALWSSGVFEARIAAGKLLTKARIRGPEEKQVWHMVAAWVPEFDGWAIADHAASAGERRLMAELSRLDEVEGWTATDHLWTRRAALVFTLPLARLRHPSQAEADARERVLGWAASLSADREWFIQKALAWWLRTLGDRDPDRVRAFMDAHGARMKAFARKDALRKIG